MLFGPGISFKGDAILVLHRAGKPFQSVEILFWLGISFIRYTAMARHFTL
jgi:hypothetical protein